VNVCGFLSQVVHFHGPKPREFLKYAEEGDCGGFFWLCEYGWLGCVCACMLCYVCFVINECMLCRHALLLYVLVCYGWLRCVCASMRECCCYLVCRICECCCYHVCRMCKCTLLNVHLQAVCLVDVITCGYRWGNGGSRELCACLPLTCFPEEP